MEKRLREALDVLHRHAELTELGDAILGILRAYWASKTGSKEDGPQLKARARKPLWSVGELISSNLSATRTVQVKPVAGQVVARLRFCQLQCTCGDDSPRLVNPLGLANGSAMNQGLPPQAS